LDADLPPNKLTYSVIDAPPGAAIEPATGRFTWAPLEGQGPSTNIITVRVSDDGAPSLSATNSYVVIVNEVNTAPVLVVPPDLVLDELTTLGVTILAMDVDVPANLLRLELASAPSGVSLDSINGVLTWTPSENQGPSTNTVTVKLTDDGTPSISVTNSFTVVVREVNRAPVLPALADKAVAEGDTLGFSVTALDADLPPNKLTYNFIDTPPGAAIEPDTGWFTWTPLEGQGPSTNIITVRVSDDGAPSLSATNSYVVIVNEVNTAPVLGDITNQKVAEGSELVFVVAATDPDIPPQTLFFSLDTGAPQGASINPTNGTFYWKTTEGHGPSTNEVTVRVTDSGTPNLSDTKTLRIVVEEVNAPPVLVMPPDQVMDELTTLIVTNLAIDADAPPNLLRFELVSAPLGMSLDATSGVLTWTPNENQGPSTNTVIVKLTDDGSPSISVTNSFAVVVREVNAAPVLSALADQAIAEGDMLGFSVAALDTDLPPNKLTCSFIDAPPGAAIEPDTGWFTWTPLEGQGPSTNIITVRVSDDGAPSLSATNSYVVKVNEVNTTPVLGDMTDQKVAEGSELVFVVAATDPDIPPQTLFFSLETGASQGASINSTNGTFYWETTERHGPGTNEVTVRVTDSGTPNLSDTKTFRILVEEVNAPPALVVPPDQVMDELSTLTLTNAATDADWPANILTFELIDPPEGAAIDPHSGLFAWTPTEAQGPSTNAIMVRVTDDGFPPLSVTNSFTVVVKEIHVAPTVLVYPQSQTVVAGRTVMFTAVAGGSLPLEHQWRFNGTDIPGATAAVLVLSSVQSVDAGRYMVAVSNMAGTAISASASLTVLNSAALVGQVADAIVGLPVEGATINAQGQSAVTDAEGNYHLSGLVTELKADFEADVRFGSAPLKVQLRNSSTAGRLTVSASISGYYSTTNSDAVIRPGETSRLDLWLAPIEPGKLRFVLSWGENPKDLDAHLATPLIEGAAYNISWAERGSLTSAPFAQSEIDAANGFGPETITITRCFPGLYHYYVHNFSDEWATVAAELTNSAAVVAIYTETGLAETFPAPTSGQGRYWHVCTIDGATRAIAPINRITETAELPLPQAQLLGAGPDPGDDNPDAIISKLRPGKSGGVAEGLPASDSKSLLTKRVSRAMSPAAYYASGGAIQCYWDFGDGNTSTVENPAKIYMVPGVYAVSLQVISGEQWADSVVKTNFITVVQPAPALTISRSGPNATIKWPDTQTGFSLESRRDLNRASWELVSQAPTVVGNYYVVTVPVTGNQFFRLRKP
jgi:PKD repeat protein